MNTPLFCEGCNQDRDYVIIEDRFPYRVKREHFEIEGKRAFCTTCGEELFHFEFEQENQLKAFNAYRKKYNLLNPEEIKSIRGQFNLSQQDFSILLGFSPNAISRFERGSIQTHEQNEKIKESSSHKKMLELIKQNDEKLVRK
jgi:putative zinc finger/helix-turn-helix YgiT family protein